MHRFCSVAAATSSWVTSQPAVKVTSKIVVTEGQFLVMTAHCLTILSLYFQLHILPKFSCLQTYTTLSSPFHFVPSRCPVLVANLLQFCLHASPAFPSRTTSLVPLQPCLLQSIPNFLVLPSILVTPAVLRASHLPSLVSVLHQQWHNTPRSFPPMLTSPLWSCWTTSPDAPFNLNLAVLRASWNAVLADLVITEHPQKLCKIAAEGSFLKAE